MKKLILLLFLIPNLVIAENKTCFVYSRDANWGDNDVVASTKLIREQCKSGMILDYRLYSSAEPYGQVRYDTITSRMTKFCNYDKQITTTYNEFFFGLTCVYK